MNSDEKQIWQETNQLLKAAISELQQVKFLLIQQQNRDTYRIPIDTSPEQKWPDRPTTDDIKDDEKPAFDVMR
jgi:hypothetical protein